MKHLVIAAVILTVWTAGVVTFGHVVTFANDPHKVTVTP